MKKARIEYHLHAVIERLGDFAEDFDDARAGHPIERRLKRIERVAESTHGKLVDRFDYGIRVVFDSADDAVLAACEMQHRCSSLPQGPKQKLTLRIGIHQGYVRQRAKDITDNAPEIAALLASLDDSLLISESVSEDISTKLRSITRRLNEASLTVPVLQVDWRSELPTAAFSGEPFWPSSLGLQPVAPCLVLRHGRKVLQANEETPLLTIGRDAACNLVLNDTHVSRLHCLIERKSDFILLTDSSTNGTSITPDIGDEFLLKAGSIVLRGKGLLFFGRPYKGERRGGVRFETY